MNNVKIKKAKNLLKVVNFLRNNSDGFKFKDCMFKCLFEKVLLKWISSGKHNNNHVFVELLHRQIRNKRISPPGRVCRKYQKLRRMDEHYKNNG